MDPSWYEAAAFWAPEIVTISSPCPPWSGAAMQQGLHCSDGQLLMCSIALCKILRPKVILIEQVALWFAGYHLRFSHVLELGDLIAPKRARWLGVAYMIHEEDLKWPPISSWNIERSATLCEYDCILQWPAEVLSKLRVPEDALRQARLFPLERGSKQQKRCTADQAAQSHLFRPSDHSLPTFMAQYGSQHHLQGQLLETRGYFAHWLQERESELRFWHPAEIALLHGAWGGFWTHSDFEKAWKGLGNQIAIPHALWLLLQGINMLRTRDLQLRWDDIEFAGCHLVQLADGSLPIDQEQYVQKWIEEVPLSKERAKQVKSPLTRKEISRCLGLL